MSPPPIIEDEASRLASLHSLAVLDTTTETEFDELVELAAWTCHAPIAAISLVDDDRQWFKAAVGLDEREIERDLAFCAHTIADDRTLVVPDARLDARFRDNPFVTEDPEIRFYAGVPLTTPHGHRVGALCVIDTRPRSLFSDERRALEIIARQASSQLERRRLEWDSIDRLTGLSSAIAAERWLRSQDEARCRAAIHFDVDDLTTINRIHGATIGDRLLVTIADRLRASAPVGALVARTREDEFVVLLAAPHLDELPWEIERLRNSLAEPHEIDFDVSVGLATAACGRDGGDLLPAAERATALEKQLRRTC